MSAESALAPRNRAHWNIGRRTLAIPRRPLVMGILNVTPDSFSDAGANFDHERAIDVACQMQADGVDIIDIGGESTRPYSESVTAEEQLARVLPVIERLAGRVTVPISIDTTLARVAREAIAAGAEIINDVSGLEGDPEMPRVARETAAGVCVMHMRGSPQTMQNDPHYDDVVAEIERYLIERREACLRAGLLHERICLDPGIGFGKTHAHNLTLLRATSRLVALGSPILIGHSRKGFIGKVIGDAAADRMAGTLGVSLAVALAGAHVVRVHDVRATVDGLKLFEAAGGFDAEHHAR